MAVIALFVGLGIGAAGGSGKKPSPAATVTAPAQTVVQTVTAPAKTRTVVHVRKVAGPTTTVTQTVQASSTAAPASGGGNGPLSWSGNGGQTIGTITVPQDSTIRWTNDGGIFQLLDTENAVEVNSQGHSGQSALAAGTYHGFQVNAVGNWTITIAP